MTTVQAHTDRERLTMRSTGGACTAYVIKKLHLQHQHCSESIYQMRKVCYFSNKVNMHNLASHIYEEQMF